MQVNCGKSYVTVVDIDEAEAFKWEPLAGAQNVQEAPTSETFQEADD